MVEGFIGIVVFVAALITWLSALIARSEAQAQLNRPPLILIRQPRRGHRRPASSPQPVHVQLTDREPAVRAERTGDAVPSPTPRRPSDILLTAGEPRITVHDPDDYPPPATS